MDPQQRLLLEHGYQVTLAPTPDQPDPCPLAATSRARPPALHASSTPNSTPTPTPAPTPTPTPTPAANLTLAPNLTISLPLPLALSLPLTRHCTARGTPRPSSAGATAPATKRPSVSSSECGPVSSRPA